MNTETKISKLSKAELDLAAKRCRDNVPTGCEDKAEAAAKRGDYRDEAIWWLAGAYASAGHGRRQRYQEAGERALSKDAEVNGARNSPKPTRRAPRFNVAAMQNVSLDGFSAPDMRGPGRYDDPRTATKAALSCEFDGARFHVWLNPQTWELCTGYLEGTLYKNPPEGTKTTDPGYYSARHLDINAKFGRAMIAAMVSFAEVHKLREVATREFLARVAAEDLESARRAWDAKRNALAPEMLAILSGMVAPGIGQVADGLVAARYLVAGLGVRP